jgi:hypothetical protein
MNADRLEEVRARAAAAGLRVTRRVDGRLDICGGAQGLSAGQLEQLLAGDDLGDMVHAAAMATTAPRGVFVALRRRRT